MLRVPAKQPEACDLGAWRVLFQDRALFGSMNIYDNVAFPLREHTRKSEREIRDIVMEKLEMVGLTGAEQKLPGQISGGMKKRAGLARALVLDPEIVLFDEPDSGLDPVRTAFLNELILDLNKKLGPTMLVVTHDIATARRVADHVGMLYLRNLIYFGSKQECFDSDVPAVRQFLSGDTRGPIGMSEESDQGRRDIDAVSTSGMTAQETEELERQAGAPDQPSHQPAEPRTGRVQSVHASEDDGKQAKREFLWIPDVETDKEKEVPVRDLFGPAQNGGGQRRPARRRSGGQ
jgi:phospholipid/cholesterol/gamma-HCH transport system ATP-binding protein